MNKKLLSISIIIIITALMTGCGQKSVSNDKSPNAGNQAPQTVEIGKPAPPFELKDLDGNVVKLSDFKGKAVMLNFWGTWCNPCVSEMPEIESVAYENKDVVLVGISSYEGVNTVKKFVEKNGYTSIKFIMDNDGEVGRKYSVQGIPTSVFIDKKGIVLNIIIGSRDKSTFQREIDKLK